MLLSSFNHIWSVDFLCYPESPRHQCTTTQQSIISQISFSSPSVSLVNLLFYFLDRSFFCWCYVTILLWWRHKKTSWWTKSLSPLQNNRIFRKMTKLMLHIQYTQRDTVNYSRKKVRHNEKACISVTVLANGIQIINDNNDNIYMYIVQELLLLYACARAFHSVLFRILCVMMVNGLWTKKKQNDQLKSSDGSRSSYIVQAIYENVMTWDLRDRMCV